MMFLHGHGTDQAIWRLLVPYFKTDCQVVQLGLVGAATAPQTIPAVAVQFPAHSRRLKARGSISHWPTAPRYVTRMPPSSGVRRRNTLNRASTSTPTLR